MADKVSQALKDLLALRDLLSVPERWTQRYYATTERGFPIGPTCPNAVCWCLVGGCAKITGNPSTTQPRNDRDVALWRALDQVKGPFVPLEQINDELDHAGVLALIDRAIAQEREKP